MACSWILQLAVESLLLVSEILLKRRIPLSTCLRCVPIVMGCVLQRIAENRVVLRRVCSQDLAKSPFPAPRGSPQLRIRCRHGSLGKRPMVGITKHSQHVRLIDRIVAYEAIQAFASTLGERITAEPAAGGGVVEGAGWELAAQQAQR